MSDADPAAAFERLYREAAERGESLPWDRGEPHPLLRAWARQVEGRGRPALVVGSGFGSDAELIAAHGFDVVAFDVSPTAVASARRRFPDSAVRYTVANLLEPPPEWSEAFDLVVESLTVQSMPIALHGRAIASVAGMVAPGGTLLAIATARQEEGPVDGPPWPLTQEEVESFAAHGLEPVRIEEVRDPGVPVRWRAEFRRRTPVG